MEGDVFAELIMHWPAEVLPDPECCFFRCSLKLTFACRPSWPYSFEPHVKSYPSTETAAVCRLPQLIWATRASKLLTLMGKLCRRKSPCPSWPS